MSEERRKFDSDDVYINYSARLTKDPEVYTGDKKDRDGKPLPPLVRLTFTSDSRREGTETLWVEAKVRDWDACIATWLEKGDQLPIEGKPTLEAYTNKDGVKKTTFKLDGAKLHINVPLLMTLKERGFTPGAVKGAGKPKPAGRGPVGRQARREVEDVFFGDED
jgi:single-stranded DNA-binding protein